MPLYPRKTSGLETNPQIIDKGGFVSFVVQDTVDGSIRNQDRIRRATADVIFVVKIGRQGDPKQTGLHVTQLHHLNPIVVIGLRSLEGIDDQWIGIFWLERVIAGQVHVPHDFPEYA